MNHSDECQAAGEKRRGAWASNPYDIAAQRRLAAREKAARRSCDACQLERRQEFVKKLTDEAIAINKLETQRSA